MFKMNTVGDYHDIYLIPDVLLLADLFVSFISTCLEYYGLDPCHHFSSPGLSWNEFLQVAKIELKLFCKNIDMYLLNEKGIRGGISYIAKRSSKANSKCIISYGNKKPSKFVIYLDANNLYC